MATSLWSGVSVSVQSALAAAIPVDGITKASPGVLTHSGADPTVGDFVLLKIQGMHQVDSRVFRVATVVAATSFELEGEDTTLYDTFVSGTFEVVTLGTSLTSLTTVNGSGGEPEFADKTTIHDLVRRQEPTVLSAITYSMSSRFDPGDTALQALQAAHNSKAQRVVMFVFKSGAIQLFNGFVSFPFLATGSAQGLVESPLTFTVEGQPTVYAS